MVSSSAKELTTLGIIYLNGYDVERKSVDAVGLPFGEKSKIGTYGSEFWTICFILIPQPCSPGEDPALNNFAESN